MVARQKKLNVNFVQQPLFAAFSLHGKVPEYGVDSWVRILTLFVANAFQRIYCQSLLFGRVRIETLWTNKY